VITLLSHVEPVDNLNRWYLVSIQATLFYPCAVVIAWGRRDNDFQQWRAIPIETPAQAQELANRIVKKKLQRGYQICPLPNPDA
jgi:predicted DNA-binding WGR domain protein